MFGRKVCVLARTKLEALACDPIFSVLQMYIFVSSSHRRVVGLARNTNCAVCCEESDGLCLLRFFCIGADMCDDGRLCGC